MEGEHYYNCIERPEDFLTVIAHILEHHQTSGNKNLIITLTGDLGAGKTAFTKVLGAHLGITEPIVSPTFNIMKQYPIEGSEQFDELIHIDAYRLEDAAEASPLRLQNLFTQSHKLICIEWPQILSDIIPDHAIHLELTIKLDESREVLVSYPNL